MLIYARNQTFCSKSVNKAPKILIFGLSTLCGILSNCTKVWKNAGIKINFLTMYFNVLCISLFFRPFVFVVFFGEICGRHFLKHNNAKTLISAIESKNKHIYMNYAKKTQFALILYTKSHFGAIFGPTCMYKKWRNFRTVPPGVTNLVSKCAGNSKERSHKVSRRELCALQSNRAKCQGGPKRPPPPQSF